MPQITATPTARAATVTVASAAAAAATAAPAATGAYKGCHRAGLNDRGAVYLSGQLEERETGCQTGDL